VDGAGISPDRGSDSDNDGSRSENGGVEERWEIPQRPAPVLTNLRTKSDGDSITEKLGIDFDPESRPACINFKSAVAVYIIRI